MTTPNTNFNINVNNTGIYKDLSTIFMPLGTSTAGPNTSFVVNNTNYSNTDLSQIFAPISV
jgi:hypothetical protein